MTQTSRRPLRAQGQPSLVLVTCEVFPESHLQSPDPQLAEYPTLQGFTLTCRANGFKELGKGQRVWEGAGEEDTDRERKPARWPGPEDSARLPQGHGGQ